MFVYLSSCRRPATIPSEAPVTRQIQGYPDSLVKRRRVNTLPDYIKPVNTNPLELSDGFMTHSGDDRIRGTYDNKIPKSTYVKNEVIYIQTCVRDYVRIFIELTRVAIQRRFHRRHLQQDK